jgi:hypothetical protein
VLYGVWIVATIIFQFPGPLTRYLAKLDLFAVLPVWTFFAPNPSTTDYHLVIRDRTCRGECTRFSEVAACQRRRRFIDSIWYPSRRFTKVLHDVVTDLVRLAPLVTAAEVKLTSPYLTLANYVCALPATADVQARQFAIILTEGFVSPQGPVLLFTSEFHRLPDLAK